MHIKSVLYAGVSTFSQVEKINRAKYAFNAVPNAIAHMQTNAYSARLCEIYDERDGTLHAIIKRGIKGDITILFKRTVKQGK